MSTSKSTLRDELAEYNQHLDSRLRSRWSVSLKTFKSIKALTQLAGVAVGFYAISQGADPLTAFALVAFLVNGPEALEYLINNTEA